MNARAQLQRIRGRVRLLGDGVNTDVHCSSKYLPGTGTDFIATRAFEDLAPGFARRFEPGDVIVAGYNFGINSSREQAVHVLRAMGCTAIVARSFGRQLFRNAINNGLPVVECDLEGVVDGDRIEIDLSAGALQVPERKVSIRFVALPAAVQAILCAGGLHPFLKANPNWQMEQS